MMLFFCVLINKEEVNLKDLENKRYWVWLSLIKNLGSKRKQKLLEVYKTPTRIYSLNRKQLLEISGIGETLVENILDENIRKSVDNHLNYMQKNNIDIISIQDKEYPNILKEIYDPPISLYIKGKKEILNHKAIAIVGCREVSDYGKKAAKYFSYNLANQNVNIVSGLAKGVDSYAHIGSICAHLRETYPQKTSYPHVHNLNSCGKTIAVVGNGLDIVYPSENKQLAENILESGGAIISEYPLGTKPEKMNFPARNRIISGMSKGLIVIEAKEKSGTLITVDFALEQGREVYVVPGNINSINSVGTNELIKQGAKMVTNYGEIEI